MWHQYYPFFVEFRQKLLHGGSLQYSWSMGMGTAYVSLFAYYLSSPLYLLSALVPASLLREFFALLVVVKISLAGLFFAIFLRTVYRRNELALVFFSLLYALCAFVAGYYWNIIWLDTLALLPLLVAGTVSLLREGRFRLYITALALSLWCSYYIAFFCCIFVALCFLGYCICCWQGVTNFLRRFARIALCTLIGVSITAVLLLPTLKALQNTHSAGGRGAGAAGPEHRHRGGWQTGRRSKRGRNGRPGDVARSGLRRPPGSGQSAHRYLPHQNGGPS